MAVAVPSLRVLLTSVEVLLQRNRRWLCASVGGGGVWTFERTRETHVTQRHKRVSVWYPSFLHPTKLLFYLEVPSTERHFLVERPNRPHGRMELDVRHLEHA